MRCSVQDACKLSPRDFERVLLKANADAIVRTQRLKDARKQAGNG